MYITLSRDMILELFFFPVILPTACEININILISQSRKCGGSRKVKLSIQAQKYIYTKADVCSALQTGNPSLPERWRSPALGYRPLLGLLSCRSSSFFYYSFFQPRDRTVTFSLCRHLPLTGSASGQMMVPSQKESGNQSLGQKVCHLWSRDMVSHLDGAK